MADDARPLVRNDGYSGSAKPLPRMNAATAESIQQLIAAKAKPQQPMASPSLASPPPADEKKK